MGIDNETGWVEEVDKRYGKDSFVSNILKMFLAPLILNDSLDYDKENNK